MNWHKNMYFGEEARKKKTKIIYNIDTHKLQVGVYVLTFAANGTDLIDIIPSFMLEKEGYKGRDIVVIGLAASKDEAYEVGRQIITDVYEQTGGFDVRSYFA